MRQKPRFPSMISWVLSKPFSADQRRQHAILRRLAGVEGFAHGAAVLLHAGGLRRRDPHHVGEFLRIEPDQLAGRGSRRDGAERTGRCQPPL